MPKGSKTHKESEYAYKKETHCQWFSPAYGAFNFTSMVRSRMIHTFGDSHSSYGWSNIPDLQTHHLGPILCFSIGRDGIQIRDGQGVHSGDTVIFCFGEIDCRCHIQKHITESTSYHNIIDGIVENYVKRIKEAVEGLHLRTALYNVVPPIQKHNTEENPQYPYLGTDEERKAYVLYFNQKLKQKCEEYEFLFFNVYEKYTDENGYLNKSLSDGNVHIRNGIHIQEFIRENGL